MRLRSAWLLAALVALLLPATADAKPFWGKTSAGQDVNLLVVDADKPFEFSASWHIRCKGAPATSYGTTRFQVDQRFVRPGRFDATSNDNGTPIGPFVRGQANATGRVRKVAGRPEKERWNGTFRITLEVFVDDRKVAQCTRNMRWTAWREGYGKGTWRMTSEPGDWIGQGGTYAYDSRTTPMEATGDRREIRFGVGGFEGDSWLAYFAAPKGRRLRAGRTYAGAQRITAPEGLPGMDVSGNNRSCNTLRGSFTVRVARYDKRGRMLAFTVDFVQHCESGEPALRGTLVWKGKR